MKIHAVEDDRLLVEARTWGTDEDGEMVEIVQLVVERIRGDQLALAEFFPPEALEAALERFAALG